MEFLHAAGAIACSVMLAGCTWSPASGPATSAPAPTTTVRAPATPVRPPSASTAPGTPPATGKAPRTILGQGGVPVRVVEADPNYTPTCRRLNERERVEITLTLRGTRVDDKRPARAVDLPEEGFAVVAYWGREDGKAVAPYALVTGGGHFSDLYPGWVGTHTLAGVAFMDGPRAWDAARTCIGAKD